MVKVGFLGLGIMGGPMAGNLLRAGFPLAVWSHTASKAEAFRAQGATVCATPAEVAQHADVVFLCVGDTAMSREVILGADGLASAARPGLVIADCSTVSPSASRAIATELQARNIAFLDAPCTGSKGGAESATLTFMVGGDQAVFEQLRPCFQAMGKQLYYCGAHGMGLQAKLSQNLILGNLLQAFNESLVLSTKAGVPPELMLEILENSAAKSGLVSLKAPLVLARDFDTRFSIKWLEKDMALMLESAAEQNVPVPLTSLSRQMYRMAIAQGYGEDDICASIRVLEQTAGCTVQAGANSAAQPAPTVSRHNA
ncbi:MAG: NAD(P)-dependent oxidoreductase [Acidobacteriota bacterium]|nr:NAD(P)-dependent oxidoreductase [Acidobacteriota bacterium]